MQIHFHNIRFVFRTGLSLLSVAGNNSITLLKTISASFSCFSISLLDRDTFLVSTVDHQRPVRTIDVHGNEGDLQHKLLPEQSYKVDKSACTYIPSTKTLVFLDTEQQSLYMCEIMTGEGRVIKNDILQDAIAVCAGPNGSTFVCCVRSHLIMELSLLGDVLTSHQAGMLFPRTVSVSKDGTRFEHTDRM